MVIYRRDIYYLNYIGDFTEGTHVPCSIIIWMNREQCCIACDSLSELLSIYTRVKIDQIFTTTTTYILAPSEMNSVPPHSLHGHLKEKLMICITEL